MPERRPIYQEVVDLIRGKTRKQEGFERINGVTPRDPAAMSGFDRLYMDVTGDGVPKPIFRSEIPASPEDMGRFRTKLELFKRWVVIESSDIRAEPELSPMADDLEDGEIDVERPLRDMYFSAIVLNGQVEDMIFSITADYAQILVDIDDRFGLEIKFLDDGISPAPRMYRSRGSMLEMTPEECRLMTSVMDEYSHRYAIGDVGEIR